MGKPKWTTTETNRLYNDQPEISQRSTKGMGSPRNERNFAETKTTCGHKTGYNATIITKIS